VKASKTFTVATTQDETPEKNETFSVVLSNATGGASIKSKSGTATGTITDDDGSSTFSIADSSATEGGLITFTVTRTGNAQVNQTVDFGTSVGTGPRAAGPDDFTASSGTLIFAVGVTSQTFTVQTTQDQTPEKNETFSVALSNPTGGASISSNSGIATGTINDDDSTPKGNPNASGTIAPVFLDLDGDGQISYLNAHDGVVWDYGSGLTNSAWVDGNDGLLVYDYNSDGVIAEAKEFVFTLMGWQS